MFKKINDHPLVVIVAILGSLASIGGLVVAFYPPGRAGDEEGVVRADPGARPGDVQPEGGIDPDRSDPTVDEPVQREDPDDAGPDLGPAEGDPPVAVEPWTLVDTLGRHDHRVSCMAFDATGEHLVSGSLVGGIRVWRFATGETLRVLEPQEKQVGGRAETYGVDVRARDSLVAAGHGRVYRLWDLESGEEVRAIEDGGATYNGVAFSPDGSTLALATSEHGLELVDTETRKSRTAGDASMHSVAFGPDGTQCATTGQDTVYLWNTSSLDVPRREIPDDRRLTCVAFRPNGEQVAVGGRASVVVWNTGTGRSEHVLSGEGPSYSFHAVAYNPAGTLLAAGGKGGVVRVWNAETGESVAELNVDITGPGRYVHCLRFNPDGTRLATGHGDGAIRIWSTE